MESKLERYKRLYREVVALEDQVIAWTDGWTRERKNLSSRISYRNREMAKLVESCPEVRAYKEMQDQQAREAIKASPIGFMLNPNWMHELGDDFPL